MLLSIVVVSYNTKNLTLQTLRSVHEELDRFPDLKQQTEIFVVDNNSSDGSVAALKKFKGLTLKIIENAENLGFPQANNQAMAKTKGEYVLLLNSDTIVQVSAFHNLLETFAVFPRLGILAPVLLNQDGSVQPQGGAFPNLLSLTVHMLMLDDLPILGRLLPSTQHTGLNARPIDPISTESTRSLRLIKSDWVGGTAMLIRREVIEEVGVLDDNIFMYGEDVEFCMRTKHHHWEVAILPSAQIIHLGSASSSAGNALKGEFKGYLYIWSKHKPLWQLAWVKWLLKIGATLRVFVFGTMVKRPTQAQVYREILKEGLLA